MLGIEKLSNLTQRVIAGTIGAIVLVISVVVSKWSFVSIFTLVMLLSLVEFYKLFIKAGLKPLVWAGTFFSMSCWYIMLEEALWHTKFLNAYWLWLMPTLTVPFLVKLYQKNDTQPFHSIAVTFIGVIYVTIPWVLFLRLGFQKESYSYTLPLGVLLYIWANDTGAYFTGKFFGKHKLFERISPKKTWEGLTGGFLLTQLVAFVGSYYIRSIEVWRWWFISVVVVIWGTWGDLVESMLKRSLQIKDSGSIIPGHGGFLDRFDALMLATPWISLLLEI